MKSSFLSDVKSYLWQYRVWLVAGLALLVMCLGAFYVHGQGNVLPTNRWMDLYSMNSTYLGRPLQPGDYVAVFDPQGVQCGEFTVHTEGYYGIMPCYGDDPDTAVDEGAEEGDVLRFTINGSSAASTPAIVIWQNHELQRVDLSVEPTPSLVWRFRGYVYRGLPGNTAQPLSDVTLTLYGYDSKGQSTPTWYKTTVTDQGGFFNFYIIQPYVFDVMRLVVQPPEGMIAVAAKSEDGKVLNPAEIEWENPEPKVHFSQFFLDVPTPTPTSTATPTPTPTSTPTPTMTPTFTPTSLPPTFLPMILREHPAR